MGSPGIPGSAGPPGPAGRDGKPGAVGKAYEENLYSGRLCCRSLSGAYLPPCLPA